MNFLIRVNQKNYFLEWCPCWKMAA